jgi:hypothetical protein
MRVRVTVGAESLVRQFYYALLYERSVNQSHLATRGWCLQGGTLPSKTIHFGHYGAIWKCTSLFESQVLPSGDTSGPGVDILLGIEDRAHFG